MPQKEIEKMKFTKETLRRAWRTFIQVAIPIVLANLAALPITEGKEAVRLALISAIVTAVATGLAAVMNLEDKESE